MGFEGFIIMAVVAIISAAFGGVLQKRQNSQLAAQQNQYNVEMAEQQNQYNQEALDKQLEANSLTHQFQELRDLGINEHYAAQYLTHNQAVFTPNQAAQKNAPAGIDITGMMQGLAGQLNTAIGRDMQQQNNAANRMLKQIEIDIKKQNADLQREIMQIDKEYKAGKLTALQRENRITEAIENQMFTDPNTGITAPVWYWRGQKEASESQESAWNTSMLRNKAIIEGEAHELNMELLRTRIQNMVDDNYRADQQQANLNAAERRAADKYKNYDSKLLQMAVDEIEDDKKAKKFAAKLLELDYNNKANDKILDKYVFGEIDKLDIAPGKKVALKVIYNFLKTKFMYSNISSAAAASIFD